MVVVNKGYLLIIIRENLLLEEINKPSFLHLLPGVKILLHEKKYPAVFFRYLFVWRFNKPELCA